jgi:hypothetical protein
MSALPPHREAFAEAENASRVGARWAVLEGAGRTVAQLAGKGGEFGGGTDMAASMAALHPAGADLAVRAIDDLAAVLEPGIGALLAVRERGLDPAPAAAALWGEFCLARNALLALAPKPGA